MTLPSDTLPFGIRRIVLTPINPDGTLNVAGKARLPVGRTLTFNETEDVTELRGDDKLAATHGNGAVVAWSLEAGGISLEAWAILTGATLTATGVTPAQKNKLNKKGSVSRPYFQIEGQSISDSGGDVHVVIYKAKAEGDIGGDFAEGQFFLTSCSGRGLADDADNVWDVVQNETAVDPSV